MLRLLTTALVSASILFTATTASALDRDAATDARNSFITDREGKCVRTRWQSLDDACAPKKPEPVQVVVEQPKPRKISEITANEKIVYFGFDDATLTAQAQNKLNSLISIVRQSKRVVQAKIAGHTDEIGSNSYNDRLSVKRANAVAKYLSDNSAIDTEVVTLSGLGEAYPVVTNCTKDMAKNTRINCLQNNRRVEIHLEVLQERME